MTVPTFVRCSINGNFLLRQLTICEHIVGCLYINTYADYIIIVIVLNKL